MGEVAEKKPPTEFEHLVIAKFKEDVNIEEIMKGLEKLASDIDSVKSFKWGEDMESPEMLRQGFTHAFVITFDSKDEYQKFVCHQKHVEFAGKFSAAIEKVVVLDFNVVSFKPSLESTTPPAPTSTETETAGDAVTDK